jgi:anaerobic magnesium-protoporphyrin IX monomethyl ester cyclase
MKVLLVEANDVARWVGGRVGPRVHVVPVALLGLGAYVEEQVPGTEVRVIESSLDAPTDEELTRVLDDFLPDLVGVRSINFFAEEARRVVALAAGWRNVPVVLGGPIATALRQELFTLIPELRLAAVGEGEHVLAALAAGGVPEQTPGMLSCTDHGVQYSPESPEIEDLDALPWPDYSLVDLERYARHLSYAYNHRRQGVLSTSRGCPYRCTYCFQLPNSRARLRSAENVVAEIEHLRLRHDVRDFYVVDDIFNLSRRRALEVFDRLEAARFDVRLYFVNGLRVDRCDHEFIDRMLEAGAVWVTFGIETAHPRIARLIKKEVDLDHARDIIAYAQSSGIAVNIDTMFGFPTETPDEARATLDWLSELPRPSLLPYHFNLRGYAGCEVVDQAVAAGWDREVFLATGFLSYNDLPTGTPTFSRHQMIEHLLEYHQRFGLKNPTHLRQSVQILRHISYTDAEILDLYTVLMNRPVSSIDQLLTGQ